MNKKDFSKAFAKNMLKMYYIFFLNYEKIHNDILNFRKKYRIKKELKDIVLFSQKDNYDDLLDRIDHEVPQFCQKNKSKREEYLTDIYVLCKQLNLGKEWHPPIFHYAVTGIITCPPYSVYVKMKDQKTLVFEINKDTTNIDLLMCWEQTKNLRKEHFDKARATFPAKKSWDDLNLLIKDFIIKNDGVYFDEANLACYEKTDLDVAGEIFEDSDDISEESDRKRRNKLRVNRCRAKKRYK